MLRVEVVLFAFGCFDCLCLIVLYGLVSYLVVCLLIKFSLFCVGCLFALYTYFGWLCLLYVCYLISLQPFVF